MNHSERRRHGPEDPIVAAGSEVRSPWPFGVSASRVPSPYVHQRPRLGLRVVTEPASCLPRRVARDQRGAPAPSAPRPHRYQFQGPTICRTSPCVRDMSATQDPCSGALVGARVEITSHRGCCGGRSGRALRRDLLGRGSGPAKASDSGPSQATFLTSGYRHPRAPTTSRRARSSDPHLCVPRPTAAMSDGL
jgi:hypothetical protein